MKDKSISDPATAPSDPVTVDPAAELVAEPTVRLEPVAWPEPAKESKASKEEKEKVLEAAPSVQVMDTEMTRQMISQFHINVLDIAILRFQDERGVRYQLDNRGNGRYELRMVGE